MPNRNVHAVAGVVAGSLAAALTWSSVPEDAHGAYFGGTIAGGLGGGLLPDLLEPATSPNHRGVCHSYGAGMTMMSLFDAQLPGRLLERAERIAADAAALDENSEQRARLVHHALFLRFAAGAMVGFVAGYLSHLALDAQTRKSIPILFT